jgi:hypothetical protein
VELTEATEGLKLSHVTFDGTVPALGPLAKVTAAWTEVPDAMDVVVTVTDRVGAGSVDEPPQARASQKATRAVDIDRIGDLLRCE